MRRTARILAAAVAVLVLTTAEADARRGGPPRAGKPCPKVGAVTGGGPNVTLRCERRKDGRGRVRKVWRKLKAPRPGAGGNTSAGGDQRPSEQPGAPAGEACTAPNGDVRFPAAFTDAAGVVRITLGRETNDPRFVYVWLADPSTPLPIYAPVDGELFRIRHKTANAMFPSDDYDLFFRGDCGVVVRFNHITAPRADLKATYPAGDQPSGAYVNGGLDYPERVEPRQHIRVRAGEPLGATTGTPGAHDWDYSVYVNGVAVCPFDPYDEPLASRFRALLAPLNGSPGGGYPCEVESRPY